MNVGKFKTKVQIKKFKLEDDTQLIGFKEHPLNKI